VKKRSAGPEHIRRLRRERQNASRERKGLPPREVREDRSPKKVAESEPSDQSNGDGEGNPFEDELRNNCDELEKKLISCNQRIPGFRDCVQDEIIQSDLGKIELLYLAHDVMNGEGYKNAARWTGGTRELDSSDQAFKQYRILIDNLSKLIATYLVCNDYTEKVVIIKPPRGNAGRIPPGKRRPLIDHYDHLGYRIAHNVKNTVQKLDSIEIEHILSFNLFEPNFPKTWPKMNWKKKTQEKYGMWKERVSPPLSRKIKDADCIIIADDTMISYMGMMRIAMAVRNHNKSAPILCATVFALSGPDPQSGLGWDTPLILYPLLKSHVGGVDELLKDLGL